MAGKVPDMRGMLARFVKIPAGRAYLVQVPGTANSTLNDQQTAEVLNWLVRKMGPQDLVFKPYGASEVARLRAVKLHDPKAVRAELLSTLSTTS